MEYLFAKLPPPELSKVHVKNKKNLERVLSFLFIIAVKNKGAIFAQNK